MKKILIDWLIVLRTVQELVYFYLRLTKYFIAIILKQKQKERQDTQELSQ